MINVTGKDGVEMKTHLVMPMGGAGSRFFKNGFMQPKPLIEINNKPFFYWATMSIKKYINTADLTYVVLQEHIDTYGIDSVINQFFPEARIISLPEILPGPVFTSMKGTEHIYDDYPIIFNDCDHMFKCSKLNKLLNDNEYSADGALLTFDSLEPQFSYVKYDNYGKIIGTIEKKVVSNHAICGAYIFKSAKLFNEMASKYIENCPYKECFMSGIYNVMCENNMRIDDYFLDYHVEFGTPEEYKKAKESQYFCELI